MLMKTGGALSCGAGPRSHSSAKAGPATSAAVAPSTVRRDRRVVDDCCRMLFSLALEWIPDDGLRSGILRRLGFANKGEAGRSVELSLATNTCSYPARSACRPPP